MYIIIVYYLLFVYNLHALDVRILYNINYIFIKIIIIIKTLIYVFYKRLID